MKKSASYLLGLFLVFQAGTLLAQNTGVVQTTQPATVDPQMVADAPEIYNVYKKIHIAQKKPIPYVPIREADVMWSKDVWRIIDLARS
jgi:hypothetical protein